MTNPLLETWERNKPKKKFKHIDLKLPKLERETIDGIRFYKIPNKEKLVKYVSITSVTSHYSKEKFAEWRKRKGDEVANKIVKASTSRGSALHEMVEHYLMNDKVPNKGPLATLLFDSVKSVLNRIDNIHAIESSLYSEYFNIAGTVDTIAEFDGVLSIIDYKTSEKPKPREWIENYFVQATAYLCMFYELTGIKAKQLVIIMTCENGEVEVYIEKNIPKYIKLLAKYIKKFTVDKENEFELNRSV